MNLGFTGSRDEVTDVQLGWLYDTLDEQHPAEVHHGCCVCADAACHAACLDRDIPVHVWPPTNGRYLAQECLAVHQLVFVHHAMPYLNRNREIVRATTGLIALPSKPEEDWGGTWYTVHFAERMNKPVVICHPDGRIEVRNK